MGVKFIILALLVAVAVGDEAVDGDAALEEQLQRFKHDLYEWYCELIDPSVIRGHDTGYARLIHATKEIHEAHEPIYNFMKSVDINSVKSQKLKNAVLMWTLFRNDLISLQERVVYAKNSVQLMMKGLNDTYCDYHNRGECNLVYKRDVAQHLSMTSDPEELIFFWKQWREMITEEDIDTFKEFARVMKTIVDREDKPVELLWYFRYGQGFFDELTKVYEDILPFYKQLHTYIRHSLREKYGTKYIPEAGPIPQEFLDQILAQAVSSESPLGLPYPEKLVNLTEILILKGFGGKKYLEVSNDFYNSIGLNDLPSDFIEKHVKQATEEDCLIVTMTNPCLDTKLNVCPRNDLYAFMQAYEPTMEVRYKNQAEHLPVILDWEVCPGFITALSVPAKLSTLTPAYLKHLQILETDTIDEETEINRLYRAALFAFLDLPMLIAHEKSWIQIIGAEDLNAMDVIYAKNLLQFAGIHVPHVGEGYKSVMSYDFLKGLAPFKPNTEKIFAEVMGYQFYRDLCVKEGLYHPDSEGSLLKDCNLYGHESIGATLNDMMSLGSSKSWGDIVEPLTGTKHLTSTGILEYFKPLKIWLEAQNAKSREPVGW